MGSSAGPAPAGRILPTPRCSLRPARLPQLSCTRVALVSQEFACYFYCVNKPSWFSTQLPGAGCVCWVRGTGRSTTFHLSGARTRSFCPTNWSTAGGTAAPACCGWDPSSQQLGTLCWQRVTPCLLSPSVEQGQPSHAQQDGLLTTPRVAREASAGRMLVSSCCPH